MTHRYILYSFSELNSVLLYEILRLRSEVFVVEQHSPYLDLDGMDQNALHHCVFKGENLIGYARIFAPGVKFDEASIGRIVIAPDFRGVGLGKALIQRSMQEIQAHHANAPIRIEAQHHLRIFYESLGFFIVSDIYDWGGIPHVKMCTQVAA